MVWTTIDPYGESSYRYWIKGIYKIVRYTSSRHKGQPGYHAYFIGPHERNWGEHVCPGNYRDPVSGTSCFRTLSDAKQVCDTHAVNYIPGTEQLQAAKRCTATFLELENKHLLNQRGL